MCVTVFYLRRFKIVSKYNRRCFSNSLSFKLLLISTSHHLNAFEASFWYVWWSKPRLHKVFRFLNNVVCWLSFSSRKAQIYRKASCLLESGGHMCTCSWMGSSRLSGMNFFGKWHRGVLEFLRLLQRTDREHSQYVPSLSLPIRLAVVHRPANRGLEDSAIGTGTGTANLITSLSVIELCRGTAKEAVSLDVKCRLARPGGWHRNCRCIVIFLPSGEISRHSFYCSSSFYIAVRLICCHHVKYWFG